ncbi:TPA: hypothetical protein HA251_03390 [Candidatus Woesearchaeota archaeon]|nr:hypothetical protein [Candidatus Woesearchaeota archaeon]
MKITNETLGVLLDIERRGTRPVEDTMMQLDLQADLLTEYRTAGLDIDRETIERAIILHTSRPFQHRVTKSMVGLAYVRRALIGKVAAGVLAASMAVQAGDAYIDHRKDVRLRAEEARVEASLENQWYAIDARGKQIAGESHSLESSTLPNDERAAARSAINRATQHNQDMLRVLREISPRESIADKITKENYSTVESNVKNALTALAGEQQIEKELGRVERTLDEHKQLGELGTYFTGIARQIKGLEIDEGSRRQLLQQCAEGQEHVAQRHLEPAINTQKNINLTITEAQAYIKMETDARTAIAAITAIPPAEQAAKESLEQLSAQYRSAAQSRNGSAMQRTAQNLSALEATLNLTYDLIINDRVGERTGVVRDDTKQYIVVRPMRNGENISVKIMDEELGQTVEARVFAIRVPFNGDTFNSVHRDKKDNNTVDNNLFGTKKRGYLNTTFAFQNDGKYITEW